MIKAIIFDLGGVYFTEGMSIAAKKISSKFNVPEEMIRKSLSSRREVGALYRKGEITAEEFWSRVTKEWGITADYDELTEIWANSYEITDTATIVKRLKNAGIRPFFLSDSIKERVEYLQKKYNFLENFIGGVFSYEVHKTKVDREDSFRMALAKTGERAENVVFVDDKEDFVETARKIGMQAVHFKNPEQLEKELKAFGLEF